MSAPAGRDRPPRRGPRDAFVHAFAAAREALRAFLFGRREDAHTAEEIAFHLDLEAERLAREEGLDPAEARRRAAVAFGGVEKHREAARDARGFAWVSTLSLDVKLGARLLRKHPGLTLVGGLGMAVGIAASAGFFTFMMAHIYPDLPLPDGERIVALENRDAEVNNEDRRALHDFVTWREELRTVQDLGAFRDVYRNLITGEGPPEGVTVAEMTAAGFQVARTPPLLGRYLVADDERPGAPPVVVVGYDAWQERFAGDPEIVGRNIRLGAAVHTVVGVMPEGFAFPMQHQYWTPFRESPLAYERREGPELFIFGRLSPGVTLADAQAELEAIGRRTAAAFPESHAQIRPMVMPYVHSLTDVQGISLWEVSTMQGMMTVVLLVVALNVALLIYARTATRRGEIAVRSALGARRRRVIGQLFLEALLLAAGATVVGLALAQVGIRLGDGLMAAEMGRPFWVDYGLRTETVAWTVGVMVLTAVIVGVLPGIQATGRGLQSDLRQLGGGTDMRLGKVWTALIVAQIAIALIGLPAAVNMGWQEIRFATTTANFPAEEVMTAMLRTEAEAEEIGETEATADRTPAERSGGTAAPGLVEARAPEASGAFGDRLEEVLRRLRAEPAVAGVTYRTQLPGRTGTIEVEGVPAPAASPAGHRISRVGVGESFLATFQQRLLAGRSFLPADFAGEATSVIVSEPFVTQVLNGGNPLGRRIRFVQPDEDAREGEAEPERWFEVVGVMRGLVSNRFDPSLVSPAIYYPVPPREARWAGIAVRLRQPAQADFGSRLREIVAAVDPTLRLGEVRSMGDVNRQMDLALRLVALGLGLVLLSVLLLSGAGIYALMSFAVTRRRREIGIRSALGAQRAHVLRSVFARSAVQIALGVSVGIGVALLLELATEGELLGGRAAVLLPAFAVLMGVTGLLAAFGPARRGLRIQPSEALRAE